MNGFDNSAGSGFALGAISDIERAPREVIKWLQGEKLSRLAAYACKSVPFYRRRFEQAGVLPTDIRTPDDMAKLPLLDAEDIASCYPFGMFAVSKDKQSLLRVHDIPGTGHIAAAYTGSDLAARELSVSRAFGSINAKPSDIVQLAVGSWSFSDAAMLLGGVRAFGAAALPADSGDPERQLEVIRGLGADILCCPPDMALSIGKLVTDMGVDPSSLRLRAVFLCGGQWSESDRAAVESSLGAKAYAMEGFSDILAPCFAWECAMQDGLHVPEDIFYAETVDPNTGKPLPDGERGELVVTPLYSGAFPLIRLRTHRIAALSRFACACGRTSVRISRPSPIGGRSAEDAERTAGSVPGMGADTGENGDYTDYSDFSFLHK